MSRRCNVNSLQPYLKALSPPCSTQTQIFHQRILQTSHVTNEKFWPNTHLNPLYPTCNPKTIPCIPHSLVTFTCYFSLTTKYQSVFLRNYFLPFLVIKLKTSNTESTNPPTFHNMQLLFCSSNQYHYLS